MSFFFSASLPQMNTENIYNYKVKKKKEKRKSKVMEGKESERRKLKWYFSL